MGECGCGEINPTQAFRIGKAIMVVDEYTGCRYCGTGLCPTLLFFDTEAHAREWIGDLPIVDLKPDEYGTQRVFIPQVGKEEMVKGAQSLTARRGIDLKQYERLEDVMEDFGLILLQEAMKHRAKPQNKTTGG